MFISAELRPGLCVRAVCNNIHRLTHPWIWLTIVLYPSGTQRDLLMYSLASPLQMKTYNGSLFPLPMYWKERERHLQVKAMSLCISFTGRADTGGNGSVNAIISASTLWENWDFLQGRTQIFFIKFLPSLNSFHPLLPQLCGTVTPLHDSHCVLRFSSEIYLFWTATEKLTLVLCQSFCSEIITAGCIHTAFFWR